MKILLMCVRLTALLIWLSVVEHSRSSEPKVQVMEGSRVVDRQRMFREMTFHLRFALQTIEETKVAGTFDETLQQVSKFQERAILEVAWYLIAIEEYLEHGPEVDQFLLEVERGMSSVEIPPWICTRQQFGRNVDGRVLMDPKTGTPINDPDYRTFGNLVVEVRERLDDKEAGRPPKRSKKIRR